MSCHRVKTEESPVRDVLQNAIARRISRAGRLLRRARRNAHAIWWCGFLAWWHGATPGRHAAGRKGSVRYRSSLPPATGRREPFSVLRSVWSAAPAIAAATGEYRLTELRFPPYLTN